MSSQFPLKEKGGTFATRVSKFCLGPQMSHCESNTQTSESEVVKVVDSVFDSRYLLAVVALELVVHQERAKTTV